MKAVAYVSSIPSFALGNDPSRQLQRIRAYAVANGISICRRFRDTSTDHGSKERPVWLEALAYCQNRKVRTILVDFYERLSTDAVSGLLMVEMCRAAGVDLIDCVMKTTLVIDNDYIKLAHRSLFFSSQFHRGIAAEDAEVLA